MSDIFREFGDADPEDEWDDLDAFRERLAIIRRTVEDLQARIAERDDRFDGRRAEALRLLRKLAVEHDEDSRLLDLLRSELDAL